MGISDLLAFLPDDLKNRLLNGLVNGVADQTEKMPGGDKLAKAIRQFSSQAAFNNAFDQAMRGAVRRFTEEYMEEDEDLVEAIMSDTAFWQSKDVQESLMELVRRPGAWLKNEQNTLARHFSDVLPKRVNRKRVDKALNFLVRCILEEMWTLPGVGEIREIYNLQFQKFSVETAHQQVALLEAQLQATTQLSVDLRQALLQLATTLEQRLLSAPLQPSLPGVYPYHNLPQPDYTRFIGRQKELEWLRQRLSPGDRAWQMVIVGIGGVGKSSLALAIAHDYREHYLMMLPEERFEAIIWISAKEEILTISGPEKSALTGLTFRNLEDMYTTIAQTLRREDITRASLDEQGRLVQNALNAQRTLLLVDNFESVTDERVRIFLRYLPLPTKCVITSREWVDMADVLRLTGMPFEEAENLISEEAMVRSVKLGMIEQQLLFNRTSGLPLPIKLSVARIASGETFSQIMSWLGNYATGDLPDYCVKGQIDIAHKYNDNAWKLLLVCSLFDRNIGASREALGAIADLSLTDRDEGLALLQRLSLLCQTEDERFLMLPMIQEYAGSQLIEADFGKILTERWLEWLLQFMQQYSIDLELHVEQMQIVSSEYPNLLGAIRWCRDQGEWRTLLLLAKGTWSYPYLVGLFSEYHEILEAAIQAAEELRDGFSMGRFLSRLGVLFWMQGQSEKSLEYLNKAEEIDLQYGYEVELGWVYDTHSDILSHQGYLQEAERLAETMLEIGERDNNLELKIAAGYRLSEFASKKRQFDTALEWLDRAERWCREFGWSRGLAWIMFGRGSTLAQQGNSNQAESFLVESLKMAASWNEHHLMARIKERLAQVYSDTNRLHPARQTAEEARNLYERLGMNELSKHMEELIKNWS